MSEYGLRLIEKQKLCRNYGVTERQLRRLMILARAADGPTGERLLERLERRLDNVVFRAGFARTIPAARQLVNHGHITVDGKKVDRSSYSVAARCVERAREGSLARATSAWQWACTARAAAGDLLVASLGESGSVTPGGSGAGGLPSPAPCPLRSLSTPYNIDNDCQ